MGGMPRRIGDLQRAVAHREALAAAEDVHVLLGHGQELAPQPVHVVAVEPRRAAQQLLGIDHVRRPPLMHVDLDVGVLAHQGAGRSGVIEMDVGQENRPHVGRRDALGPERRAQRVETRRRTRVHEGRPARVLEDGGGDDPGLAEEHQVGVGDAACNRWHGSRILLCRTVQEPVGRPVQEPVGRPVQEPVAKGPAARERRGILPDCVVARSRVCSAVTMPEMLPRHALSGRPSPVSVQRGTSPRVPDDRRRLDAAAVSIV